MEALFINKFKHTKENLIEMNRSYNGIKIFILRVVLFAAFLILSAFWIFELYDIISGIATLVLGIIFAVLPTIVDRYKAGKEEKRLLILYNEIPESTTFFNDDHLFSTSETTNGELKLEYNKIIKVKQSKNLYLLILKERLVVMVDKNRFEKGTCEEFEEFIKSKAINAKIKL